MKTSRNSELTFKHNRDRGRHGWLRLTPAYSISLVDNIINNLNDTIKVLDPFSGTGTTILCSSYKGIRSFATDINPFLIWLNKSKLDIYSEDDINNILDISHKITMNIRNNQDLMSDTPAISNIERWWSNSNLLFLRQIKYWINYFSDHIDDKCVNLLKISFCRLMISISNASFNHQSMSFKNDNQIAMEFEQNILENMFISNIDYIINTASLNPKVKNEIYLQDARYIDKIPENNFNVVITSPPYPNRMSYIRELRPYMYWLDFLSDGRMAGELDWQAIGGTWGIATSRLKDWKPDSDVYYPDYLLDIIDKISCENNKNGVLLSNYILKYFQDIWYHFQNLVNILETGSNLNYIVGNSTFYAINLPVQEIYSDIMKRIGCKNINIEIIRKRNSKKELFEFNVTSLIE